MSEMTDDDALTPETLRHHYEDDAARQAILTHVRLTEKMDSFSNWVLVSAAAPAGLILANWKEAHTALGSIPGLIVVAILLVSMAAGFVARFQSFQALLAIEPWTSLPGSLMEARDKYVAVATRTRIQVQEFDIDRINARINSVCNPPDSMPKGWRLLIWRAMDALVGLMSIKALDQKTVEAEWKLTSMAAWRVGAVLWLIVFQMFTLFVAVLVAFGAVAVHG
jgi:hypothetical protein